jgi:glutamine amidotransferase
MCNLFSVSHACSHAGIDAVVTRDPSEILRADGVILPGVGAFGDAMKNLSKLDLIPVIKDAIGSGKPFMGICLGLQLLFCESEEFGAFKGLGIISGTVKQFPKSFENRKIKVPQVGWNRIFKQKEEPVLKNVPDGSFMYFVHSYYVEPTDKSTVLTNTDYEGLRYCSGIQHDNIIAFQFHPEKSAATGLGIYQSWKHTHKEIR